MLLVARRARENHPWPRSMLSRPWNAESPRQSTPSMRAANTLIERSTSLGMDLEPHLDSGRLVIEALNAAELSPGHFAHRVRERVEQTRPE